MDGDDDDDEGDDDDYDDDPGHDHGHAVVDDEDVVDDDDDDDDDDEDDHCDGDSGGDVDGLMLPTMLMMAVARDAMVIVTATMLTWCSRRRASAAPEGSPAFCFSHRWRCVC